MKSYIKFPKVARRSSTAWTVPALCAAYDWPTNLAGGGVIGIIELGGGWVQSDINAYFSSIGQPAPSITDISIDGVGTNNGNVTDPASGEVALDIQVAAAAYFAATSKPATIRMYWASNTNDAIMRGILRAARDGCDVCSISWGADEAAWSGTDLHRLGNAAITATQMGMVIFAAAGDNDSADGGPTPANVDAPASCAHIIGCGGTSKTGNSETVWNNNPGQSTGEGTGGGYSTYFKPASATWQLSAPTPPTGLGRMVPDVAANADPNTGYKIMLGGRNIIVGGTSADAPLYSGLFAGFGRKLGFVTPKLWANPTAFNDITVGDNGKYNATVGPDPCTGLGSPIGSRIAMLLT